MTPRMLFAALVFAAVEGPAIAQSPLPYVVDGLTLGGRVNLESSAYREYECSPSEQFAGFTWCQRQREEKSRRGTVISTRSILHSQDGTTAYVNRSIKPAFFGPADIPNEIDRLSRKFGERPHVTQMPRREEIRNASIGIWGKIQLDPLDAEAISVLASGRSLQKGILVDFLGDLQLSARRGLPVYRLTGEAGYLWSASRDQSGRGHLRFLTIDASALARPGIAGLPNSFPMNQPETPPTPPQASSPRTTGPLFSNDTDISNKDCAGELARARALGQEFRVAIEAPQQPRVGAPIKVRWRKERGGRPRTPAYFVLTTPPAARFAGTGFMALVAGAKGPHGLVHGGDQSRAIVPLHRPIDTAENGDILIIPYQQGTQTIGWSIVTAGQCGEEVVGGGSQTVTVGVGRPEIVVQDRFTTEHPLKRIRSRAGTHDLLVFKGRYEVHEVDTGARILSRAGVDPNFSPGSRFVAARRDGERFEVFALLSGELIASMESPGGGLAWSRGDSYLVYGGPGRSEIGLWNTLLNGPALLHASLGCSGCSALESGIRLDIDEGFFVTRDEGTVDDIGWWWRLVDLVTHVVEGVDIEQMASDRADQIKSLERIRRDYGISLETMNNKWELGEPLAFSHIELWKQDSEDGVMPLAARYLALNELQKRSLVKHITEREIRSVTLAESPGRLTGRARSGRGSEEEEKSTSANRQPPGIASQIVIFNRLARTGIATLASQALTRIYLADYIYDNYDEKINEITRKLRASIPESARIWAPKNQDWDTRCEAKDAPPRPIQIWPKAILQVWRVDNTNGKWLLQMRCEGNGGAGTELVVIEGSSLRVLTDTVAPDQGFGRGTPVSDFRQEVFRLNEALLAICSPAGPTLMRRSMLVDMQTGMRVGAEMPMPDGSAVTAMRLTPDGRHLVQLNNDGRFYVHRVADGKTVLIGAHVDDEIVVATEDGLYDTTYEGAQAVQVRFPGMRGLHRYNQFEAMLRRPGLATAVLSGGTIAPPPTSVSSPPTAELTLDATAKNGRRRGTVRATAEGTLASVRLYLDGRLLQTMPAAGARAQIAVDVDDSGGGRWISAVAIDAAGLASLPSAIQIPGPPKPRGIMRAVLIGVDIYEDVGLPRLAYAKSDAQRLARVLAASRGKSVQEVRATPLLGAQANPQRILAALREAAQATGPDDMLVVFYAGHGIDGKAEGQPGAGLVLTTATTRMTQLAATAVPWADLAGTLAEARGTTVVLLDACHAGIAGREAFATNDDVVSALITRAGAPMVVLAGSKGRQLSQEDRRAGGGLFTAALAKVIAEARVTHDRDGSGLIDLGELYATVKSFVLSATRGQQTPWLARNALVGEMALF